MKATAPKQNTNISAGIPSDQKPNINFAHYTRRA
jgi:hypothetical protein